MNTSAIVIVVLGILLLAAIVSKNNADAKNTPKVIQEVVDDKPLAKSVLASDLVSKLRENMKSSGQSVSEIGVKFYEPTK